MNYLFKILILLLIFTSCKTEEKIEIPKSNFNLKNDFASLTHKITELDTIKVWTNLSLCTYQGVEKLKITRKGDSLKIEQQFAESMILGAEYINSKPILIHINDTIWKFNAFLKRQSHRLETDSLQYGRLRITCNKKRLNFMTGRIGDTAKFLTDYCNTMMNLMPESENHIFAEHK